MEVINQAVEMNTLFPLTESNPEGFSYYRDFISDVEEQQLIAEIRNIDLHPFRFQGYEAKRKVSSFGFDYSFETGSLSQGKEIPAAFNSLIQKVGEKLSVSPHDFAELLLTEYPQGSVINWHRDAPPFDLIAGISLAGDCLFRFRPYEKQKQGRHSVISINVARRSLYVIQGIARTDWQHSIQPVKSLRYSITLRTLRQALNKKRFDSH